ncbi:MAG: hypothetical protein K8S13_20500 [Desulfobacula sp.]|uniref:Spy/CpxP family protein refolding chaperone n=1 Tax=Desulfobacula sp. TaxID=2593537 RepID=UPI0025BEBB3C|nr:Spy/CpxP family protein refolding chaperone [Desulfobacula sp.]MCD4722215.1 hypothetical protein [Desulfobacula sp.]
MTKKKKVTLIVSITILAMVISGFGFVMITGACGFNSAHGHRFHKRGMPSFIQKEIGSFILWRMDKGIETLDLSDTQQELYDGFRTRVQETMEKGLETRMEFKKQALLEFEKETPDLSVMAVKIQSHVEMMSSSLSENLTLFTNFYNSLDSDQQRMITQKIKEKIEDHKKL